MLKVTILRRLKIELSLRLSVEGRNEIVYVHTSHLILYASIIFCVCNWHWPDITEYMRWDSEFKTGTDVTWEWYIIITLKNGKSATALLYKKLWKCGMSCDVWSAAGLGNVST